MLVGFPWNSLNVGRLPLGTGSYMEGLEQTIHVSGFGKVGNGVVEGACGTVVEHEYVAVQVGVVELEMVQEFGVGSSPDVDILVRVDGDGYGTWLARS